MKILYTQTHGRAASLKHIPSDVLLLAISGSLDKHPMFSVLDSQCEGMLTAQATMDEFKPEPGNTMVRALPKLGSAHVVVFGIGAGDQVSMRKGLTAAFQKSRSLKARRVALASIANSDDDLQGIGELVGEIATTANHNPLTYKTEHSGYKAPQQFEELKMAAPAEQFIELKKGITRGVSIGEAINFGGDLASEPANIITPAAFRDRAQAVADASGGTITTKVLDKEELTKLNAQGILMVSRGSDEPPFLIELTYTPKNPTSATELVLIGKTVTFDTGGNDIKSGDGMRHMKRDKTGGANVLAAIRAIAALEVGIKVKAYFAATENMVGNSAFRPGDVFATMSGRTVEVGNTDAEGRLTLVEALEYAQRNGAKYVVDVATLTGAARMVAGDVAPLVFGNDSAFSKLFATAAALAHEKIAPQEMLEEVRKYNDSTIADICNTGGANGAGSMSAAWFIREWVKPGVGWIHVDIANVHSKSERSTGHLIRTLINLPRMMERTPKWNT